MTPKKKFQSRKTHTYYKEWTKKGGSENNGLKRLASIPNMNAKLKFHNDSFYGQRITRKSKHKISKTKRKLPRENKSQVTKATKKIY